MSEFQLSSEFEPRGDQPQAIERLSAALVEGRPHSVLLGVTGSGKTFTMANCIARLGKPTLVISHNKTLAAQLYSEFRDFFPRNAVAYFVSYYDYYQPEAYIPQRDIYIEKDASINPDLDRLRLAATSALMTRQDVIIVASVSCIYGLGSPEDYQAMMVPVNVGMRAERDGILRKLVDIQYDRAAAGLERGTFRVRGDAIEVYPAYEEFAYHIDFFGDEVDEIALINPLTNETLKREKGITIYPAKHFVMPEDRIENAIGAIEAELEARLAELRAAGRLLEAQRLEARTRYDLELMVEMGYCPGIENYSRHLSGRLPGQRPFTLIDYFPRDFLTIVDESHVTVPQIRGMFNGDRSRKTTLVEHGFRLPSALDNRPMTFEEWEAACPQVLFVSATPGPYELEKTHGEVVEQIIRPTGLVDPLIRVASARDQVPHLLGELRTRAQRHERALVTTLTKRLAEDLSEYIKEAGLKCQYLHSDLDAFERVEILKSLRLGHFDCVVGVNLLREGLDLPEVSLVAILDADKEGFLRSETSLIQTIGRAARNVNAEVVLYADTVTDSMKRAIDETNRRREAQLDYNREHHITPKTIQKAIRDGIEAEVASRTAARDAIHASESRFVTIEYIHELEADMMEAAQALDFERAAELRDRIAALQEGMTGAATNPQAPHARPPGGRGGPAAGKKPRRRRSRV
jgi:excinuclease ABC subunit B